MNQRGNPLLIFALILAALVLIVPAIMYVVPEAFLIMQIVLIFAIWNAVRGFIGDGYLTLLITGVLVWFLVIKHPILSATFYMVFFIFLGLNIFGTVMWTAQSFLRPKAG